MDGWINVYCVYCKSQVWLTMETLGKESKQLGNNYARPDDKLSQTPLNQTFFYNISFPRMYGRINEFKTHLKGSIQCGINPCIRSAISFPAALQALPSG